MDPSWEGIADSLRSAAAFLRRNPGSPIRSTIAERLTAAAEGRCDREPECRRCPVACWSPGQTLRMRGARNGC